MRVCNQPTSQAAEDSRAKDKEAEAMTKGLWPIIRNLNKDNLNSLFINQLIRRQVGIGATSSGRCRNHRYYISGSGIAPSAVNP